jgi:hypothetical protein
VGWFRHGGCRQCPFFVSEEVESISGQHPELDSGFTLFCEVLVAGLT